GTARAELRARASTPPSACSGAEPTPGAARAHGAAGPAGRHGGHDALHDVTAREVEKGLDVLGKGPLEAISEPIREPCGSAPTLHGAPARADGLLRRFCQHRPRRPGLRHAFPGEGPSWRCDHGHLLCPRAAAGRRPREVPSAPDRAARWRVTCAPRTASRSQEGFESGLAAQSVDDSVCFLLRRVLHARGAARGPAERRDARAHHRGTLDGATSHPSVAALDVGGVVEEAPERLPPRGFCRDEGAALPAQVHAGARGAAAGALRIGAAGRLRRVVAGRAGQLCGCQISRRAWR
ncbi:unnamed protein product, partial [Prorocentrum cordatum]